MPSLPWGSIKLREDDRERFKAMLEPGHVADPDPELARLIRRWFAELNRKRNAAAQQARVNHDDDATNRGRAGTG
jgi:hypothetical protein